MNEMKGKNELIENLEIKKKKSYTNSLLHVAFGTYTVGMCFAAVSAFNQK